MTKKKQSDDLKISLETVRRINWLDEIHQLPNDVDKKILDQCSDIIEEFLENNDLFPIKGKKLKTKRQISKIKKLKSNIRKTKQPKTKVKLSRKKVQALNYNNLSSTNAYPCYPSAFPCFRSCGPIKCPKNKIPMPRDLWYRIVYSQALEQQFGSGEASTLQQSSKRKYKEDESVTNILQKNKSANTNPRQQQTMNAAISSISTKISKLEDHIDENYLQKTEQNQQMIPMDSSKTSPTDHLDYVAETLPLTKEISLWNADVNKTILSTQSAHVEVVNRSKIPQGASADAVLEHKYNTNITLNQETNLTVESMPIPSAPSASIVLNNQIDIHKPTTDNIQPEKSDQSIQQSLQKHSEGHVPVELSAVFGHPMLNQLYEYYHLDDIPRLQLFKRLSRRLTHIQQTLKTMSFNDIEIKLKYKRDALVKKRQTPVQSLTKDERIAMVELELNVYEYVQALDEPSSKSFHLNPTEELNIEQLSPNPSIVPSYDTVLPLTKSAIVTERSASTVNTVRPSMMSQSTAMLSTITQYSPQTEKLSSWNHPLQENLMNMFEQLTTLQKGQIHKQLTRRYEHIRKKAHELNEIQLQTQIDSKSKALEQNQQIPHPNKTELLRIAELELSLFELRNEQAQRHHLNH